MDTEYVKPGRQFERAVYDFAKSIAPNAEVIFNHKATDKETGSPRQCDVWINALLFGHLPISILISCKDCGRKLAVGAIEQFAGEMQSTGVTVGVIYSRTGFTKDALTKAAEKNISCCRLYESEPGELPTSIYFDYFYCYPKFRIEVDNLRGFPDLETYSELLELEIHPANTEVTKLLDYLVDLYKQVLTEMSSELAKSNQTPQGRVISFTYGTSFQDRAFNLRIFAGYTYYRAKCEATLLKGSYCLNNSSYVGSISLPIIDSLGSTPGNGWEPIQENTVLTLNPLVVSLEPEPRQFLIDVLGKLPVTLREQT